MVLFQFGVAAAINHDIMLYSTLLVIAFLIAAEMATGVLEYIVRESPIYNKMIQKIYKMLMFLGIISFTLLLLQSVAHPSKDLLQYLKAIDFAHIILFFVALFFVLHVLYLMYLGTTISKMYRSLHKERDDTLLSMVDRLENDIWDRIIYNNNPFSFLRQKVKFKIIHSLFRDNYSLPETFDFASYLNGCFEGYALKIIDIGIYGWVIIIFLSLTNYIRIKYNGAFNCSNNFGSSFHIQRYLAQGGDADDIISKEFLSEECIQKQYTLYLLCGCIVSIYSILMLIISYVYEARLIKKCGITAVDEYKMYLEFAVADLTRSTKILNDDSTLLVGMKELKKNIEELIDANECSENDEDKMYKYMAEKLSEIIYYIRETLHTLRSYIFQYFSSFFRGRSIPRRDKTKSILLIENKDRGLPLQGRRSAGVAIGLKNKEKEKEKLKISLSKKGHKLGGLETQVTSATGTQNNKLLPTEEKLILEKFKKAIDDQSQKIQSASNAADNSSPTIRRSSIFSKAQFEVASELINSSNLSDGQVTGKRNNMRKRRSVVVIKATNEDSSLVRFRESMMHRNSISPRGSISSLNSSYCPAIFTRLYNYISSKVRKVIPIQRRESLPSEVKLSDDFSIIFLFGSKELYARAVETSIIFNCLYLAMAVTTFIPSVIAELHKKDIIYLFIPVVISLFCFGKITRICSMLMAVCDLDLEVIHTVLAQEIDARQLADEFRVTMEAKITEFKLQNPEYLSLSLRETVEQVFEEIDEDGSGTIDSIEFRKMLRQLNLFYSDRRFNTLYFSMDIDGDGGVTIDELEKFIFTPEQLKREEELIRLREDMKLELGEKDDDDDESSSNSSSSDTNDYKVISENSTHQQLDTLNFGDCKKNEQIFSDNYCANSDGNSSIGSDAPVEKVLNAHPEVNEDTEIRKAQTTVLAT